MAFKLTNGQITELSSLFGNLDNPKTASNYDPNDRSAYESTNGSMILPAMANSAYAKCKPIITH